MRRLHWFAVGFHLAGLVLFAWLYSLSGEPLYGLFAGWCCVFGALSLKAVREMRGVRM